MGPIAVEVFDEVIERGLLFEGEVHAFMPAVLLGMARFDALDADAQSQPPDRKLREIEQTVRRGEGHAIVRANGPRQPALSEETLKGCKRRLFGIRFHGFAE